MKFKNSQEARERRAAIAADIETLADGAAAEERELTEAEEQSRAKLLEEAADAEIEELRLAADEKATERADRVRKAAEVRQRLGIDTTEANAVGGAVTAVHEARTYERGNGLSFFRDLCAMGFGQGVMGGEYFRAQARLMKHGQENHYHALEVDRRGADTRKAHEQYFLRQMIEVTNTRADTQGATLRDGSHKRAGAYDMLSQRAMSTASGAGGEFVPPMYLTADFIAFLRAGRVFADACHHEDLPDGTMSINIPKITSGVAVGTQGSQNTNTTFGDLATQFVTLPVVTKDGSSIVSIQLLERSPIAFDRIVLQDMALAYAQQVDIACLLGAGAPDVTGVYNTSGINAVTWTQASPTAGGFNGRIGVAKADIATAIFLPATHAFMTPTRWEWLAQSLDGQGRPLVVPDYSGPFNALQVGPDAAVAEGVVGRMLNGLQTFEDANIPSNISSTQDLVFVSRMEENWLMESPVVTRALPQTYGQQLSVLLQMYGYIAFTAARYPTANTVISGTGLTTPTFNS